MDRGVELGARRLSASLLACGLAGCVVVPPLDPGAVATGDPIATATIDPELAAQAQAAVLPEVCHGQVSSPVPSEAFLQAKLASPRTVGVYVQDTKIGWGEYRYERLDASDGLPARYRLVAAFAMRMSVELPGEPTQELEGTITESATFAATAPYPLLHMELRSEFTDDDLEVDAIERVGEYFVLTSTRTGVTRRQAYHAFEYMLGDHAATDLWLREAGTTLAPGAALTRVTLSVDPDTERRLGCTRTILAERGEIWIAGGSQRVLDIVSVDLEHPNAEVSREQRSEDGETLRMWSSDLEFRTEPPELARELGEGLRLNPYQALPADKPLGDSSELVRLELTIVNAEPSMFEQTAMQQVRAVDGGVRLIIDVRRPFVAGLVTSRERIDALAETSTYPAADPTVVALSERAIAGASSDAEKVRRLVEFVHEFMEFGHSQGSVMRTLETRSGDCTETSDLFTTLARAAGIPARTVNGFGYTNDGLQSFGGHAWNEVVIDGEWVAVDATWGQVRADASHIRESEEHGTLLDLGQGRYSVVVEAVERR